MIINEKRESHKVIGYVQDGSIMFYDVGHLLLRAIGPGLVPIGETIQEVLYQRANGSWTTNYYSARQSFEDAELREKYAKRTNAWSKWWFRFWFDNNNILK